MDRLQLSFGKSPPIGCEEIVDFLVKQYCIFLSVSSIDLMKKAFSKFVGFIRFYERFVDVLVEFPDSYDDNYSDQLMFFYEKYKQPNNVFISKTKESKEIDKALLDFKILLREYNALPSYVSGYGQRGQFMIDQKYKEIIKFQEEHQNIPQIVNHVVQKYHCSDDGTYGMSSGLAVGFTNY